MKRTIRYVTYGVLLLLAGLLPFTGRLRLLGVCPMLPPLCVSAGAVLEGPVFGTAFGLAASLFFAFFPGMEPLPLLPLAGLLSGLLFQFKKTSPLLSALCSGLLSLGLTMLFPVVLRLCAGAQFLPLLQTAGKELLCSMLFCLPLFFLFGGFGTRTCPPFPDNL